MRGSLEGGTIGRDGLPDGQGPGRRSGLTFEDAGEHELKGFPTAGTCIGSSRRDGPGNALHVPRRREARLPGARRGPRPAVREPWFTDLELQWDEPGISAFLARLASFSRLILVDKRGIGRSERVPPDAFPRLETRVEDLVAVLDAVGSSEPVVVSGSESGPLAIAFAAAHPIACGGCRCTRVARDTARPCPTIRSATGKRSWTRGWTSYGPNGERPPSLGSSTTGWRRASRRTPRRSRGSRPSCRSRHIRDGEQYVLVSGGMLHKNKNSLRQYLRVSILQRSKYDDRFW